MFKKTLMEPDFEYFTLFDTKVGTYREPILAINRHDILRQLNQMFRDPKHTENQLVTNAEDFQLFKIGSFTKKTGEIGTCTPEHIANLHEIRSAVERSRPPAPKMRDLQQELPLGIEAT